MSRSLVSYCCVAHLYFLSSIQHRISCKGGRFAKPQGFLATYLLTFAPLRETSFSLSLQKISQSSLNPKNGYFYYRRGNDG
jgi:hypothetical protein